MNINDKISSLKKEIDSLRPLKSELNEKLWQYYRLKWNYHSNKIEGNTLSYGETKALLLFGITAGGKPLKDHLEIRGHNEAVLYLMDIVKDEETDISENLIRNIHKLILPENYIIQTKDQFGNISTRQIEPGSYKRYPNHVITSTGENLFFASPQETPSMMSDLISWYRNEKDKLSSLQLASIFHYKFVKIHPFDDGNGRLARLLMNLIFMKNDFPPVIIENEVKTDYYQALQYADIDEIEKFVQYIGNKLLESMGLYLSVLKGKINFEV